MAQIIKLKIHVGDVHSGQSIRRRGIRMYTFNVDICIYIPSVFRRKSELDSLCYEISKLDIKRQ